MKAMCNLNFCKHLQLNHCGRLVALDMGSRQIGVAVCDESRYFCSPLGSIARSIRGVNVEASNEILSKLDGILISKNVKNITGIIVGLPIFENKMTKFCHDIVDLFTLMESIQTSQLKVVPGYYTFWDESNSTANAKEMIHQFTNKRAVRMNEKDAIAASLIMESFLEHPTVIKQNIRDNSLYKKGV